MGTEPTPDAPLLSVVIPTLNEAEHLPRLVDDLRSLRIPHEIIVADGGSTDRTAEAAEEADARWLDAPPGRGTQLRAGAAAARARLLFFVHADARLDPETLARLDAMANAPPEEAIAFRLRIDSPRRIYRVLERGTNFRARFLRLPYGDQGLVVRADAYRAAGGYPPIPLMEDVALVRSLRRTVGVRLDHESIHVSARRWESDGPLRRTFRNLLLLMRYLLGADPHRLARSYRANG